MNLDIDNLEELKLKAIIGAVIFLPIFFMNMYISYIWCLGVFIIFSLLDIKDKSKK